MQPDRIFLLRLWDAIRRRSMVLDRPVDTAAHRFVHVRGTRVANNLSRPAGVASAKANRFNVDRSSLVNDECRTLRPP